RAIRARWFAQDTAPVDADASWLVRKIAWLTLPGLVLGIVALLAFLAMAAATRRKSADEQDAARAPTVRFLIGLSISFVFAAVSGSLGTSETLARVEEEMMARVDAKLRAQPAVTLADVDYELSRVTDAAYNTEIEKISNATREFRRMVEARTLTGVEDLRAS